MKGNVNHRDCTLQPLLGFAGLTLRKRKKTSVVLDEPRAGKPLAVLLSLGAVTASVAVVFNVFFNQSLPGAGKSALVPDGLSAHVRVGAGDKTSRTITLKYDALVEDVQRELLATGHFNGLVDGVTGPRTKIAIETYQTDNKLAVTGEASKKLLEHILLTRKGNQAAEFTGTVKGKVEEPAQPAPQLAAVPKPAKKAGEETQGDKTIAKLQQRLSALGYEPGSRSGQMDEGTRSAILIFEMDHGLPMHGKVSQSLLDAVKSAEAKPKKKN
jgi:peptidoglycan hydrolase-like protein with peptidoglycan-binding domain